MRRLLVVAFALLVLTACSQSGPTPIVTGPTPATTATLSSTFQALKKGDQVEGAEVDYAYTLPNGTSPVIQVVFGKNMLHLGNINPQMQEGLISFARELNSEPQSLLGFDEREPNQSVPRSITLTPGAPVQFVVIKIPDGDRAWSVRETQEGEVRSAYKLIRRGDGGLRFVLAFDISAMNSFSSIAPQGAGAGLVYSARLALIKSILTDQRYQQGIDVFAANPPGTDKYDARILKLDPSREAMAQNVDWVIMTRPVPNAGIPLP